MRYDRLFQTLAERAAAQGGVDLETFIAMALESGVSMDAIQEQLLNDIATGGPVFGRYVRSMEGAATQTVLAANDQGTTIGEMSGRADVRDVTGLDEDEMLALLESDDPALPEKLQKIEDLDSATELMWVAELVNTCQLCLPLHGVIMTREEWKARGLNPRTIHVANGFNSPCYCSFVEVRNADAEDEAIAPLKRVPKETKTGLKVSRKTIRSITQMDIDKSLRARDKAMNSAEGRRTLRRAGQVKG